MVRPERFELPTPCFVGKCSIQLSYGRKEEPHVIVLEQSRTATGACQCKGNRVLLACLDRELEAQVCFDLVDWDHFDGIARAAIEE